jgi:hypothetical protein
MQYNITISNITFRNDSIFVFDLSYKFMSMPSIHRAINTSKYISFGQFNISYITIILKISYKILIIIF